MLCMIFLPSFLFHWIQSISRAISLMKINIYVDSIIQLKIRKNVCLTPNLGLNKRLVRLSTSWVYCTLDKIKLLKANKNRGHATYLITLF